MKKVFLILIVMIGCTIEVPVDEIEVPPIENNTTIIVNMPDGFGTLPSESISDVQSEPEIPECEYQHFPDYYP